MKVAIFGRNFDIEFKEYISLFFKKLDSYGIEPIIHEKFYTFLKTKARIPSINKNIFSTHSEIRNVADILFSIGGDGTILDAANIVRDSNIPIIGINTGKLGFLASVASNEIELAINAIVSNDYEIDERSLLKIESTTGIFRDFPYALNEITVQKVDSTMITIRVSIDDEYLNTYWADGLIISTPTGSTAYSLSVGGPIISPKSKNFILSPISPHNLTVRPLVVPDNSRLHLKMDSRALKYIVSLDHRSVKVNNTEEITICKSDFNLKLIQLNNSSFYKTLRNKLMWGVDKRN